MKPVAKIVCSERQTYDGHNWVERPAIVFVTETGFKIGDMLYTSDVSPDFLKELFTIAGGDIEANPNPCENAVLDCIRSLRKDYDDAGTELARDPQLKIADALDCFWNPALEAISQSSYHGPASGSDVVGAIARGLTAVAQRLRE